MHARVFFALVVPFITAAQPFGAVGSLFAHPPDGHPAGENDSFPAANMSAAAALQETQWSGQRNFQPDPSDHFREVPPLTQRLMELAALQGHLETLMRNSGQEANATAAEDPNRIERRLRAERRRLQTNLMGDFLSILDLFATGSNVITGTATTTRSPIQKLSNGLQSMILGAQDISAGLTEIYGGIAGATNLPSNVSNSVNNVANSGNSTAAAGNNGVVSPENASALEALLAQLAARSQQNASAV